MASLTLQRASDNINMRFQRETFSIRKKMKRSSFFANKWSASAMNLHSRNAHSPPVAGYKRPLHCLKKRSVHFGEWGRFDTSDCRNWVEHKFAFQLHFHRCKLADARPIGRCTKIVSSSSIGKRVMSSRNEKNVTSSRWKFAQILVPCFVIRRTCNPKSPIPSDKCETCVKWLCHWGNYATDSQSRYCVLFCWPINEINTVQQWAIPEMPVQTGIIKNWFIQTASHPSQWFAPFSKHVSSMESLSTWSGCCH